MMDCLPKDLWFQIFLRLPVKTILRCLSVCKSWQLFIQHPSFINSHLQHQRRDLMLVRNICYDHNETTLADKVKPECYSLHCDDEYFSVYAKHEFPIHHPFGEHYRLVGICNGVICLTDDEDSIGHQTYLWNPTIRKCVELPYPMFTFDEIGPFDHELGFGFDETTNDYKVIRIVERDHCDKAPLEVEIYSLSSGIWRKASHLASNLGVRIFIRDITGRNHQVYRNGSVHWVARRWREPSRCMVIALNLGDEVFRCFEPPLDLKCDYDWLRKLRPVVFQGYLSLIHYIKPKCYIWMMKDYGDSTSWAKYVDVNFSDKVSRVIGSRRKGELLVEIRGGLYSNEPIEGKELISVDEANLTHWKLLQEGINFVYRRFSSYDSYYSVQNRFHCESYTESLVLLGKMNSAEVAKSRAKESERMHDEHKQYPLSL